MSTQTRHTHTNHFNLHIHTLVTFLVLFLVVMFSVLNA
jgi:hypothetical protein